MILGNLNFAARSSCRRNKRVTVGLRLSFFFFMLLRQTDKLMIGSLQAQISEDFKIDNTQWGLVNSGVLIVPTLLYPIWGYLYDRFSRTKQLAFASLIWGSTTWLNAIVKTFGGFLGTPPLALMIHPTGFVYFNRNYTVNFT